MSIIAKTVLRRDRSIPMYPPMPPIWSTHGGMTGDAYTQGSFFGIAKISYRDSGMSIYVFIPPIVSKVSHLEKSC